MQLLPLVGSFIVLAQGQNWPSDPLITSIRCWEIVDPGHCKGSFKMFGYDPYAGLCIPFFYTGCGGNPNRFQSEIECINKCKMTSEELEYDTSSSSMNQGSGDDVTDLVNILQSVEVGSGSSENTDISEPIITEEYYDKEVTPKPIEDDEGYFHNHSDNEISSES